MKSVDLSSPLWATAEGVYLVDEHVMYGDDGQVEANVDRAFLEDMARDGNRRVAETGDAVPAIVGHTTDDANDPQKPVEGYFLNFQVVPLFNTGRFALAADFKYKPEDAEYLNKFPRRSVEMWIRKRQVDPVALLGGTTPDRDLGLWRLSRNGTPQSPYSLEVPMTLPTPAKKAAPSAVPPKPAGHTRYNRPANPMTHVLPKAPVRKGREDEDDETTEDKEGKGATKEAVVAEAPEDEGVDATPLGGEGDSEAAEITASAPYQELLQKVDKLEQMFNQLLEMVGQDDGSDADAGGPPGGDEDAFDDQPAPGGDPADDGMGMGGPGGPPPGPGMAQPGDPQGQSRVNQEGPPVRFSEEGGVGFDYGYGSSTNATIPNTIPKSKKETARMNRPASTPRPAATPTRAPVNHDVVRLQREVAALRQVNLENEGERFARETVARLSRDNNILFKDEAKITETIKDIYVEGGGEKAVKAFEDTVILTSFPVKEADPTQYGGVARLSRDPLQTSATPLSPTEVAKLSAQAVAQGKSWSQVLAEKNGGAK